MDVTGANSLVHEHVNPDRPLSTGVAAEDGDDVNGYLVVAAVSK